MKIYAICIAWHNPVRNIQFMLSIFVTAQTTNLCPRLNAVQAYDHKWHVRLYFHRSAIYSFRLPHEHMNTCVKTWYQIMLFDKGAINYFLWGYGDYLMRNSVYINIIVVITATAKRVYRAAVDYKTTFFLKRMGSDWSIKSIIYWYSTMKQI